MNRNNFKIIVFVFCFILILSIGLLIFSKHNNNNITGAVTGTQTLDDAIKNKDSLIQKYNQFADEMPKFIRSVFGNEIIELNVKRETGEDYNTIIVTENGFVVDSPEEDSLEPTLNVEMNEDTFESVLNSENQVDAFTEAIKKDEIEYSAKTFGTKVKTGIADVILTVMSWF